MKDKQYIILLVGMLLFGGRCYSQNSKTDSLINQLATAQEDTNKVMTLKQIAKDLRSNNPEQALLYAQQGLALAKKLKWKNGIAQSYLWIGIIYRNFANQDSALENLYKSLKISEEIGSKLGIADAYLNIGTIYSGINNFKKGIEYNERALKIYIELDDKEFIGMTLLNIGTCYGGLRDFDKSLSYYLKSLRIFEESKDTIALIICNLNIGEIYSNFGDYKKAVKYTNYAMTVAVHRNHLNYISFAHTNLGEIKYKLGKYEDALLEIDKGLLLAKRLGNKEQEKKLYEILSKVYLKLSKYKEALESYQSFIALKDSIGFEETTQKLALLEIKDKTEKDQQRILLLSNWNEIQSLKLGRKNYFLGMLLGLLLFGIIISLLIIRHIRLKNSQKDLLLEQKASELEQKALRAQINPHFLFNALNSIQKFIVSDDQENAHEYISKFSALMRKILDNSDQTFVPIHDELEAVKLYLEIEQLRFKNQFVFSIVVELDIDINNVYMPAMIIQPYVENAIWHGLINKDTKGRVTIKVVKTAHHYNFIIEDDGIGRARAAELKSLSRNKHKSSGMKLVKDRIDSINNMRETKLQIHITDCIDNNNNKACGTKVEIMIPMES